MGGMVYDAHDGEDDVVLLDVLDASKELDVDVSSPMGRTTINSLNTLFPV
jgi:hypothetical protein